MPPVPRITLVAAVARNGVIGRDQGMPWHLPEDFRHFKALTMGHPMVMGRLTFESIGAPLPGRRSIVVTRSAGWRHPGVEVAHSLEEALARAGEGAAAGAGAGAGSGEIFVIGGGQLFAEAMPLADRMVLTEVDAEPEGDTFFPRWTAQDWVGVERRPGDGLAFVTYERRG